MDAGQAWKGDQSSTGESGTTGASRPGVEGDFSKDVAQGGQGFARSATFKGVKKSTAGGGGKRRLRKISRSGVRV